MKIRPHHQCNDHAIYVISLGCPKNRVDTECMLGILGSAGYTVTDDLRQARCVLINTCGFLEASIQEAYDEIDAVMRGKRRHGYRVVVAGCLVERLREQLQRDFPTIDAFLGVRAGAEVLAAVGDANPVASHNQYADRALTTGPAWAYLRVADGCENCCTYCTIPRIRGAFHSRPLDEILEEARVMAARGVREFNLIAQDTTRYGDDLYGRRSLDRLLDALNAVDGIHWIRVLYTHPAHYDDALIAALSRNDKVVRYLDIPLQHIADPILAAMHRRVTKAEILALLRTLRAALPGLVLRTTFIVGFPGETDEQFAELLDFVKETRFERLGAFAYSREPGTPAADLPGQVPDPVKAERVDRIMRLQQSISQALNRAREGQTLEVLAEGRSADSAYPYTGRGCADAPEIDGQVLLRANNPLTPGQFVTARIERGTEYDLYGVVEA